MTHLLFQDFFFHTVTAEPVSDTAKWVLCTHCRGTKKQTKCSRHDEKMTTNASCEILEVADGALIVQGKIQGVCKGNSCFPARRWRSNSSPDFLCICVWFNLKTLDFHKIDTKIDSASFRLNMGKCWLTESPEGNKSAKCFVKQPFSLKCTLAFWNNNGPL